MFCHANQHQSVKTGVICESRFIPVDKGCSFVTILGRRAFGVLPFSFYTLVVPGVVGSSPFGLPL